MVVNIRDRHIFPNQAQDFAVAVALAAENTVGEFLCLIPQPGLPQRSRCNSDKVKNIAVLPNQRTGRLFIIIAHDQTPFSAAAWSALSLDTVPCRIP